MLFHSNNLSVSGVYINEKQDRNGSHILHMFMCN
jgi:hypothetical protein